jgi:hypothetical protein
MAAGALFVLAMFGEAPWWSCLPIALPAFAWAGVVHNAIRHNFNFGALFDLGNFRPPTTTSFYSLHRLPIVGYQSHTLLLALLILIGIGGIGFVANIHRRFAWAYAICPIVGIGFIAINPYGNEGIFRAALFAIPWMVILAMKMPDPADFGTVIDGPAAFLETLSHRRFLGWFFRILIASLRGLRRAARALRIRRRRRSRVLALFRRDLVLSSGIATCLIVLLATFVVAAYGMDGTNVLPRDDVAVVRYLTGLPSHNSFVDSIGFADDPADGALYTLNYSPLEWIQVASARELQTLHPTSIDPIALADQFGIVAQNYGASRNSALYMIWARTVVLYTKAYGLNSPQQMLTWLHLMKTSSEWKLVKHVGSAYLFRLRY